MRYFVQYVCKNLTVKALATTASRLHWGSIMVMLREVILWLLYAVLWLLLWLLREPGERLSLWPLCQPGENKRVCSSYSILSLPPASQLEPCITWVQQTVQTFWTARQLASWKGSAIQLVRGHFLAHTWHLPTVSSHDGRVWGISPEPLL